MSWLILFRSSIASSWTTSSRVSLLYWYYKNYGFKVCVRPFSFTQYSYYHDFFCLGPAFRLRNHHCHGWVCYIDTTIITVWCVSLLILSIDLRWFCYLIMFYFKLNNDAMVKRWVVKWCNGEIKIRIFRFISHKYRICLFFYFQTQHFLSRQSNS